MKWLMVRAGQSLNSLIYGKVPRRRPNLALQATPAKTMLGQAPASQTSPLEEKNRAVMLRGDMLWPSDSQSKLPKEQRQAVLLRGGELRPESSWICSSAADIVY
jgi:hypothetical protein